jgi:cell division protein FtsB
VDEVDPARVIVALRADRDRQNKVIAKRDKRVAELEAELRNLTNGTSPLLTVRPDARRRGKMDTGATRGA